MALLEVRGMTVRFGGVAAINDLDLEVESGRLVGLIGPNGAGKTTFIDGVTGFVPCDGGLVFDGRVIDSLPAHRRARLGLARTWQAHALFDDLTVEENLQVGSQRASVGGFLLDLVRPSRPVDRTGVEFALEVLGLEALRSAMPNEISQGQRKLVSTARALATRPKLLCMDEPAAGLDTTESEDLGRRLRRIVDAGITVLLVDHDMGLVLDVCDEISVLEFGRRIAHGTPGEIAADPAVIEAYLGATSRRTDPT